MRSGESAPRGRSVGSAGGSRSTLVATRPRDVVREQKLLRAARRGDCGARERLVVSRLALIRSLAARYADQGLPYDDLVQEGALGLLDAIDHYDASRGPAFDSYARFRVRRAMRNALTAQARLVRLPKHVVERRRAIERASAQLTAAAKGRAPSSAQLAAATGLSVSAVLQARAAGRMPISLDAQRLADDRSPARTLVGPSSGDPESHAIARERRNELDAALARLPERQRRIVRRRFGLDDAPRAAVEASEELELSPRRTQTVAADALRELRALLETAQLAP
jgi:RNA polymerase primary sigma factor